MLGAKATGSFLVTSEYLSNCFFNPLAAPLFTSIAVEGVSISISAYLALLLKEYIFLLSVIITFLPRYLDIFFSYFLPFLQLDFFEKN